MKSKLGSDDGRWYVGAVVAAIAAGPLLRRSEKGRAKKGSGVRTGLYEADPDGMPPRDPNHWGVVRSGGRVGAGGISGGARGYDYRVAYGEYFLAPTSIDKTRGYVARFTGGQGEANLSIHGYELPRDAHFTEYLFPTVEEAISAARNHARKWLREEPTTLYYGDGSGVRTTLASGVTHADDLLQGVSRASARTKAGTHVGVWFVNPGVRALTAGLVPEDGRRGIVTQVMSGAGKRKSYLKGVGLYVNFGGSTVGVPPEVMVVLGPESERRSSEFAKRADLLRRAVELRKAGR